MLKGVYIGKGLAIWEAIRALQHSNIPINHQSLKPYKQVFFSKNIRLFTICAKFISSGAT